MLTLTHDFADALPALATPWSAQPAPDPRLLVLNEPLARELGLDPAWLGSEAGVQVLVGSRPPEGARPVAQAYAGHQFGGFAPRLGDGRALLLGEVRSASGALRDLHLKGSGATPYARAGDGRAAVGPMLREYVMSEAMHALGIATTRSLAVVATGGEVRRETTLDGAVLVRTASSHLRVGSVEFARASGDVRVLRDVVDYAIARHHPELDGAGPDGAGLDGAGLDGAGRALGLFRAVVAAQAELVARWMLVGFIHGVMNTDNMTLSGETIDYGPCAFMDAYDPATVFSSIDANGRYAYGNQPYMAEWNLARLAEAMLPLFDDDHARAVSLAQGVLGEFRPSFERARRDGMRLKLGLGGAGGAGVTDAEVDALAGELHGLLERSRADYTSTFRSLSAAARGDAAAFERAVGGDEAVGAWLAQWRALSPDAAMMDAANPVYVPRNHLVEEALAAATEGDLEPLGWLSTVLSTPYTERSGAERYAEPAGAEFTGGYRTFCGT